MRDPPVWSKMELQPKLNLAHYIALKCETCLATILIRPICLKIH